jgi:hypothetical protein
MANIVVKFGSWKEAFKRSVATPKTTLDHMAKMFPPRGALYHEGKDGIVILSQEEVLSQDVYIYAHPTSALALETHNSMKRAVWRLSIEQKGTSETIGSAVVVTASRLCFTTFHCIVDYLSPRGA